MGLFGDVQDPQFFEKYQGTGTVAGQISLAWGMHGSLTFLVYAKLRGIDLADVTDIEIA
jgi:hypothetical protein